MRILITAAALLAMLPAVTARAQAGRTPEEIRNIAIVERSFEQWAERRGSPFDLLSPDATWTILGPTPSAGTYDRARLQREVLEPFNAGMAGTLEPKVRRFYADGDTVIVQFEATGARKDGRTYRNAFAWFLRMRDGRVTEATAVLDLNAYDSVVASTRK